MVAGFQDWESWIEGSDKKPYFHLWPCLRGHAVSLLPDILLVEAIVACLISRRGKVFISWWGCGKVQEEHVGPIILIRSFSGGMAGEYNPFISRENDFQGGSGSVQVAGRWAWGKIVPRNPTLSVCTWEIKKKSKKFSLAELPHWGTLYSHGFSGLQMCECALWTRYGWLMKNSWQEVALCPML